MITAVPAAVIEKLRKMVTAEVREGTDLIEITARHRNAMDARDVALGVAGVSGFAGRGGVGEGGRRWICWMSIRLQARQKAFQVKLT